MKSKLSLLVLLMEIVAIVVLHSVRSREATSIQAFEKHYPINIDLGSTAQLLEQPSIPFTRLRP